MNGISLIVPCHNERETVLQTVETAVEALARSGWAFEVLVIDDGSGDGSGEKLAGLSDPRITVITHPGNLGYGASLKTGIERSRFPWIAICDADGTYPVERFGDLLSQAEANDMVVGERSGTVRAIPLLRRPAKWFLNRYCSYLVRRRIRDVNSGMRLFRREAAERFRHLLPDGFSLTTTLTLAMVLGKQRIAFVPIDYRRRRGRSKIHPLRDTANFVLLIMKTAMMFNPLRVFLPAFLVSFALSLVSLGRDIVLLNLTDTTVMLFIFSVILLMIGLLADLINKKTPL